jgi:hypothetical protein
MTNVFVVVVFVAAEYAMYRYVKTVNADIMKKIDKH